MPIIPPGSGLLIITIEGHWNLGPEMYFGNYLMIWYSIFTLYNHSLEKPLGNRHDHRRRPS
jgi:hypothetical protein